MRCLLLAILSLPAFAAPLHSNPLAHNVLFIDGSKGWTATPEQQQVTWQIVSRLYSPFNVDVTDSDPGDRADVARVIVAGSSPTPGLGGQSPVGVWHFGTLYRTIADSLYTAAVYPDSLGNDPILIGEAVAHEAGHLFGEFHTPDGVMAPILSSVIPADPWPAEINNNGVFQDTYAELGGQLGFATVPEPMFGMIGLIGIWIMGQRTRAQPAGGN